MSQMISPTHAARFIGIVCLVASFCTSSQSMSGAELLTACEQTLDTGFKGKYAMACDWYVTPCDCHHAGGEYPAACLPVDARAEDLARIVIDGLKNNPELLHRDAAYAANSILSRRYPCPD